MQIKRALLVPLFCLTGFGLGIYAVAVEPFWIEVTRHRIQAPVSSPLKIAHLTDLHTRGFGRLEKNMLAILEAEKPDLIVITGDTLDKWGTYEMVHDTLKHLNAPLGVWLVRGNWENWRPVKDDRAFYASAGIRLLVDENHPIQDGVWLVGLHDQTSANPNLEAALRSVPKEAFKIAFFHSPTFLDSIEGRCQLALAGHTHGGQVRLPFLPPLWMPPGCGRFVEGWYEKDGCRMYVSRGVGNNILPIRFLCRPEIAFITLEN